MMGKCSVNINHQTESGSSRSTRAAYDCMRFFVGAGLSLLHLVELMEIQMIQSHVFVCNHNQRQS